MSKLVILVTGTRHATVEDHLEIITEALERRIDNFLKYDGKRVLIVHGAGRGVDSIAKRVAEGYDPKQVGIAPFRAHWDEYGKRAGPIRNQQMVDFLKSSQTQPGVQVKCLAFPASNVECRGTIHTICLAKANGIPTIEIKLFIRQEEPAS